MRLIDADELKNKLQARHDNGGEDFDKGYNIGLGTAIDLIDNAPTVNDCPNCEYKLEADYIRSSSSYKELIELRKFKEENTRPQGEWLKCQNDMFRCSNCSQADEVPTAMGNPIYNFCPNCGADMREDTEA